MPERPDLSTKPRSGVGLDELLGTGQQSIAAKHTGREWMPEAEPSAHSNQAIHHLRWPESGHSQATADQVPAGTTVRNGSYAGDGATPGAADRA